MEGGLLKKNEAHGERLDSGEPESNCCYIHAWLTFLSLRLQTCSHLASLIQLFPWRGYLFVVSLDYGVGFIDEGSRWPVLKSMILARR